MFINVLCPSILNAHGNAVQMDTFLGKLDKFANSEELGRCKVIHVICEGQYVVYRRQL